MVVPGRRKITITAETCAGSQPVMTLRTTTSGRFTTLLPRAAPGAVALYRARATVEGARTFSVVLVVRG